MLSVGSLFSGTGAIELGLKEARGFKIMWNCEVEPYCSVLLQERTGLPNLGDIEHVAWQEVPRVDVLCGGSPCQDFSVAGKGEGLKGSKSRLWFNFLEAIRILRPKYVLFENVSAITKRGLHVVLAGLAEAGYDAEWLDIRALDFGAPHKRERIFLVAYTKQRGLQTKSEHALSPESLSQEQRRAKTIDKGSCQATICYSDKGLCKCSQEEVCTRRSVFGLSDWEIEPAVGRVVNGTSSRLDSYIWRERIKALGNGVVPQITKWIGERIMQAELNTEKATRRNDENS